MLKLENFGLNYHYIQIEPLLRNINNNFVILTVRFSREKCHYNQTNQDLSAFFHIIFKKGIKTIINDKIIKNKCPFLE